MRRLLLLLVVVGVIGLALTRAEPFRPTATIETPVQVVGRATPIRIVAHDRGTGLAHIDVRLIPANGTPAIVATANYPALPAHWLRGGSGVHDATVEATIDAAAAGIPEGPGTLEVTVSDHSWLASVRSAPRVTQPITVDITPPSLELVPGPHIARLGGSECLIYKASPDAVRSGVEVGETFFPGVAGLFADPALRAVLFAVPQDTPVDVKPAAVAYDAAGNRRRIDAGVEVRPRTFAEKTLQLSNDFLSRKVPDLLQQQGLDPGGDLVAGYLRVNRDGRAATERKLREICRESVPVPLWRDALLRLPNSAPLSGFADRRSYVYDGKVIDHQTHLGFDLASLRGSPVPAANNGRVVFTGPLGIYGNTVILDHGLGLFSLYGHLSEMSVTVGQTVARGDTVGKTGDTGLAAGDHLHFSTMIHGVHVDPVEWWDAHWIQDHVESRLAAFPRAASDGGGRPAN
jgi:murein DD-endopeptidase MepM/ murein hydrolase activator NlpD